MDDWKSCDNCRSIVDPSWCACRNCHDDEGNKDKSMWEKIPCRRCSGALSEIRIDKDGRPYRHCYSCHGEFYVD